MLLEYTTLDVVQGRCQRGGGAVGPGRPFEIGAPHFTFGPLVATYIQCCILKMWPPFWFLAPPSGSWPPLLLNPGDEPDVVLYQVLRVS